VEIIAIIPARGGSKGILKKNLKVLAGKPLVAHVIESAKLAGRISRIYVSTDNPEIGTVSKRYGANVIWRPPEISGDTASSESVLLHALEHLQVTELYKPDVVVFLQCTSPLTLPEDIDGAIEAFLDQNADSALAVTPFHYFLWRSDPVGNAVGINHDKTRRLLRQEQEPQFLETGAVYVVRTDGFKTARHRFFGRTAMYIMPPERCLEIDAPEDFRRAEIVIRENEEKSKIQRLPDRVTALVLDFDGVFTDNKVIVFPDGQEAVSCDRRDGWGLALLRTLGLPILVLSSETNLIVQSRCGKLKIPCLQGIDEKLPVLLEWLGQHKLDLARVVYLGNDVNDLSCLRGVGCGVAVGDAHPEAKEAAKFVLRSAGGNGAIRELAELIALKLRSD
jgi:YrbI family 3-deoxy-D-manno-octulosonate 8-phosphate phosphatase